MYNTLTDSGYIRTDVRGLCTEMVMFPLFPYWSCDRVFLRNIDKGWLLRVPILRVTILSALKGILDLVDTEKLSARLKEKKKNGFGAWNLHAIP